MSKKRAGKFELLVRGELSDPHSFLGAHETEEGAIVRAYRPDAESVVCEVGDEIVCKLEPVHAGGLFEGRLDEHVQNYVLEAHYPNGDTYRVRDPYAFLPTLGELDLHLVGEGRHLRLWEKLGARPSTEQGVPGVGFAVWAPGAKSVCAS